MRTNDSAISPIRPVLPANSTDSGHRSGLLWGLLGVLGFSFTVPLTRIAVSEGGLSPLFVGSGRAVVAAALAALALTATGQALPRGKQWLRVSVVALGVVVGFPLLTSFALTTASASHGAVVIALLPAATAGAAVWRTGERPPTAFWFMVAIGAVCAVLFALLQGGGPGSVQASDLLLFGAVIAAAIGYAEGGLLARELGAWQTISWALVISAPVMIALTGWSARGGVHSTSAGWWSFAYLGLVSMFLAFFAWYRGLAIGPMSSVSQVQLAQPVFGIIWAALLLGEPIGWSTVVGGAAVIGAAGLAVRARMRGNPRR